MRTKEELDLAIVTTARTVREKCERLERMALSRVGSDPGPIPELELLMEVHDEWTHYTNLIEERYIEIFGERPGYIYPASDPNKK